MAELALNLSPGARVEQLLRARIQGTSLRACFSPETSAGDSDDPIELQGSSGAIKSNRSKGIR